MALRPWVSSASTQSSNGGDGEQRDKETRGSTVTKMWQKLKEEYCLLEYHACPEYLKDNEFILSYYRANFSLSQALSSLFQLHNETLNIWTHLLGFLLFLLLTIFTAYEIGHLPTFWRLLLPWSERLIPLLASGSVNNGGYMHRCIQGMHHNISDHCLLHLMKEDVSQMTAPTLNRATRWPFFVFMGGSMFCLLASAVSHLFTCHSEPVAISLMRIDYAGIATMIATSFFPPIYYAFRCEPVWQWIYLSMISIMGMITVGVLFAPSLQSGKYRPFRAMMFMSIGAAGLVPAIHGLIMNWDKPFCPLTTVHEVLMAACYTLGTVVYVARIPERWMPGLFDLGGDSHSLFHILIIAGAYAHYRAALSFLE